MALIAQACNIGFEPLVRTDQPALSRARLSWVSQNFVRPETIAAANARIVAAQNALPIAHIWGSGEVASADGIRFVAPSSAIHAGPNPKYFGAGRGITYYNLVSDQFTGLNAIVVPGTLRDSLLILGLLLEQETDLDPTEIMTDTAAYADTVFGLFWLLGYQFSPRLADIGDARFWRIDRSRRLRRTQRPGAPSHRYRAHQAELGGPAAPGRIAQARPDPCRRHHARSAGQRPPDHAGPRARRTRPHREDAAHAWLHRQPGKAPPHPDPAQPPGVPTSLGPPRLPRRTGRDQKGLSPGAGGAARRPRPDPQRHCTLESTYIQAALDQLTREGWDISQPDIARVSPLAFKHINFLGRYAFDLPKAVAEGALRPLRNPNSE